MFGYDSNTERTNQMRTTCKNRMRNKKNERFSCIEGTISLGVLIQMGCLRMLVNDGNGNKNDTFKKAKVRNSLTR